MGRLRRADARTVQLEEPKSQILPEPPNTSQLVACLCKELDKDVILRNPKNVGFLGPRVQVNQSIVYPPPQSLFRSI